MNPKNQIPVNIFRPFCKSDEKGFSLIEVMIAICILSVGLLAIITMQTTSAKSNAFSARLSQAVRDCNQAQMESLLALNYNDAALNANTYGPFLNGTYSTTYTVTDNVPFTGAKTVVVTTTWSDVSGTHSASTAFVKDQIL